jgi:hypothetical protein
MNSAAWAKPERFMTLNWNERARVRCNDLLGGPPLEAAKAHPGDRLR